MATGWIKLHRKLMDSPMWTAEPFTKGQAWVDLLMLAQYEDYNNLYRGSVYKSKAFLAKRWKWDVKRVTRFLNELSDGTNNAPSLRTTNRSTNGTIVTIENWEKYQGDGSNKRTNNGTNFGTKNGNQNKNIRNNSGGGVPNGTTHRWGKDKNGNPAIILEKSGD